MSKCSGVPSKVQFKTNTDEGEDAEAISKADRNVSISLRGEFGPLISPANSRSTPSPTGDVTNALCLDGNYTPDFAEVVLLARYTDAGKSFVPSLTLRKPT